MEKDRTTAPQSVPPGIGPKLPDPPPLQPKHKGMTKREGFLAGAAGVLLALLATWFVVFAVTAGRTPAQVLAKNGDEFPVQHPIVMLSVDGGGERYLDFYVSGDALACALMERTAAGFSVQDVAGGLALTSAAKQGVWMPFGIKSDRSEYFLVGLVYDDGVTEVQVDGVPAVLVDNGVYRCWYYRGEGAMTINSDSVVFK